MTNISKKLNYIKTSIQNLLSYLFVRVYLIAMLGLNALNWLVAYTINTQVSEDLVVLHYNVDFGVNLIGDVKKIYVIPLLGLIIILINLILLVIVRKQGKLIAHILLATAVFSNWFLIMALGALYLINFR